MLQKVKLGFLFLTLFFLSPIPLRAELFQWTDARGVVHFTDNLHSVPEHLRGSPLLTIRRDIDTKSESSETSTLSEVARQDPVLEAKTPEAVIPIELEATQLDQPIIHYNPQYFHVVVVHPIVRRSKKKPCLIPEGCRTVFRPNFEDRRYIHPSAFNGGPQYVRPELFPPAHR
ncbi:MAG: DUF4124 domain-containing protein [Candidatus Binatia bacterium]